MKQSDKILTPENKLKAFRWLRADPNRLSNIINFCENYVNTSKTYPVRIGSHEFYTGISRGIYDPSQGLLALWSNLFVRSGRSTTYVYFLNKELFEEIKALQKELSIVKFSVPNQQSYVQVGYGLNATNIPQMEQQLHFLLDGIEKLKEDIEVAKKQEQISKEKRIMELQQELQQLGA